MENNIIEKTNSSIEEAVKELGEHNKLNRAQRRAQEKKSHQKKNKKVFLDNLTETTKKLVYARLIEKLREQRMEQENEAAKE